MSVWAYRFLLKVRNCNEVALFEMKSSERALQNEMENGLGSKQKRTKSQKLFKYLTTTNMMSLAFSSLAILGFTRSSLPDIASIGLRRRRKRSSLKPGPKIGKVQ